MSFRTFKLSAQEQALLIKHKLFGGFKEWLRTLAVIAVLLVIVLALGVVVRNRNGGQEKKRYETLQSELKMAEKTGQRAKQKLLLEKFLKSSPKNRVYITQAEGRLVQVCYMLRDYTCANRWGKELLTYEANDPGVFELLGTVNSLQKNDKDAVTYYKQAIELLKNTKTPDRDAHIDSLQSRISFIEGGRKP